MDSNKEKDIIDLSQVAKTVWANKKVFFKVWPVVFALSCLWIFPQPRSYTAEVLLAPEMAGESMGSLGALASSFGVNLGGESTDAIYPELYPDLIASREFIISLFNIQVQTQDGELCEDYYTYMAKHQKKNWLTQPFLKLNSTIKNFFSSKEPSKAGTAQGINPFQMSEFDYNLCEKVKENIKCSVDKKTYVITLSVKDQDALISATMADSVSQYLQNAIIKYRTRKARVDVEHYQQLADTALLEYEACVQRYAQYCDTHNDAILQSYVSKRDNMEKEMEIKFSTYTAMQTQLEAAKAKLQERTPAFTTLSGATVPIKPSAPKRMLFVIGMLFLTTIVVGLWIVKDILLNRQ